MRAFIKYLIIISLSFLLVPLNVFAFSKYEGRSFNHDSFVNGQLKERPGRGMEKRYHFELKFCTERYRFGNGFENGEIETKPGRRMKNGYNFEQNNKRGRYGFYNFDFEKIWAVVATKYGRYGHDLDGANGFKPPNGGDNGATPVPEPASLLLLGTGLVGLAGAGMRRLKQN